MQIFFLILFNKLRARDRVIISYVAAHIYCVTLWQSSQSVAHRIYPYRVCASRARVRYDRYHSNSLMYQLRTEN